MINLYKKDETTFEHNGLGSLDKNILNPEVSWKDNGAFTLEFKYPLFAKHGFEIENSSIVRASDPEGSNLFFVYKITPSMGYVTVLCYQISYKLAFNSINDTNIVNKNGQNALTQMSNATQYPHSFVFSSDIQTTATSRVVRKNPIEFLLDTSLDNSFVNRWGGHIVRHNFNISMNSAYGSNKGYTIRHKKDLKGYEAEFDESTVITRIRPVGYDGLLLPETYVDSPIINAYPEPRIQEIEYSDVKVKTKDTDEEGFSTQELAYEELRRLAQLEFSKNKVDQPDFSAKVEFVNLKETQEYQDLKSLKQVLPGDTVKVIHSDDNFNVEAQMVEYKWNPLNQSYISITLGNYTKSFTSTVVNTQNEISKVKETAQSAWTSANGKNKVYSLTYKPPIIASSAEGDLLYLKNGDKIELWILKLVDGKLQWVNEISDATQEELKAQMSQAKTDINSAVDSANAAVDKANAAVDKANASVTAVQANTQLITDVNAIANTAKSQAQTAATNAQIAQNNAGTAMSNAQTALDNYNNLTIGGRNFLLGTVDPVVIIGNGGTNQIPKNIRFSKPTLADLDIAIGDGLYFSVDIEISGSNFSGIFRPRFGTTAWINLTPDSTNYSITKAEVIKWRVPLKVLNANWLSNSRVDFRLDDVPSTVTIKATNMKLERGTKYSDWSPAPEDTIVEITNIKGELNQKVSQTNFNTLNGTVTNQATQINQNKNDILQKASKTDVDTVKGRVTSAEGSISLISGQVALKANQADVNKITDKVSAVESSITVQSGQITALNTKTDGQTTQIGKLESSYSGLVSTVANTVDGLANTNLLSNSEFLTKDGWSAWGVYDTFSIGTNQWDNYNGSNTLKIARNSNSSSDWWGVDSDKIRVYPGQKLSIGAAIFVTGAAIVSGRATIAIRYYKDSSSSMLSDVGLEIDVSKIRQKNYYLLENKIVPEEAQYAIIQIGSNGTGNYLIGQPKFVIGEKIGVYTPAKPASQSQITQMVQDLDGFKTTVANTYADKVSVASQITQSATAVTSNVQSWTNNRLTSYSTTQQTTDSITNAVANKADKSQITQLSNQITSTVTGITNESLFSTQMISSTTLKHPNYPVMPMVEVPVTNGESYTVSSNIPNSGTATVPIAHVWFLRLPSTVPASNINGVYDGKSITSPALSDKIYIAFRTQVIADRFISGEYWLKVTKTPASQSQITQLSTDINLRVSKGDVTSQINIEAGRTLIDTKQLLLNADTVKFSGSAFIPNSVIENLSADKITAGILNAANVNVINLNANNIKTGTLSAINIEGVSIEGSSITSSTSDSKASINLSGGSETFIGVSGKKLGQMRPTINAGTGVANGFAIIKAAGQIFSINAGDSNSGTSSPVIQIPANANENNVTANFFGQLKFQNIQPLDGQDIWVVSPSGRKVVLGVNGNSKLMAEDGGIATFGNFSVFNGSKNAIHVTRDGLRATPAYEMAESYLGDLGRNYTREDCEIWVEIDLLFSDTVNTNIAYEVFLQAYDDARFWVSDFKSDKFLVKSNKPMSRFAYEIKAKRRGYENERLVLQENDNEEIEKIYGEKEV